MRALARASDAIAPSDSFERKAGITTHAKKVPTVVGDFLAARGSHTAFKGERDYSATWKSGSEPVGRGRRECSKQQLLGNSRRCGPTQGAIPVGWSMGGRHLGSSERKRVNQRGIFPQAKQKKGIPPGIQNGGGVAVVEARRRSRSERHERRRRSCAASARNIRIENRVFCREFRRRAETCRGP